MTLDEAYQIDEEAFTLQQTRDPLQDIVNHIEDRIVFSQPKVDRAQADMFDVAADALETCGLMSEAETRRSWATTLRKNIITRVDWTLHTNNAAAAAATYFPGCIYRPGNSHIIESFGIFEARSLDDNRNSHDTLHNLVAGAMCSTFGRDRKLYHIPGRMIISNHWPGYRLYLDDAFIWKAAKAHINNVIKAQK